MAVGVASNILGTQHAPSCLNIDSTLIAVSKLTIIQETRRVPFAVTH